jgi:hypothetical protein
MYKKCDGLTRYPSPWAKFSFITGGNMERNKYKKKKKEEGEIWKFIDRSPFNHLKHSPLRTQANHCSSNSCYTYTPLPYPEETGKEGKKQSVSLHGQYPTPEKKRKRITSRRIARPIISSRTQLHRVIQKENHHIFCAAHPRLLK